MKIFNNIKLINGDELGEGAKIYLEFFKIPITDTLVSGYIITLLIIATMYFLVKDMNIIPNKKQMIVEFMYSTIENLIDISIGDKGKKFIPFVGAIFIYILFANVSALFPIPFIVISDSSIIVRPLLRSPTSDLNSTAALALCSIGYAVYATIKNEGIVNYLKGYASPNILFLPLNLIGEIAKPISLSVRLFGNIFSGTLIMSLLYRYIPAIFPSFFHIYFDLFAGLIQSLIFASLTTANLSSAVENTEQ